MKKATLFAPPGQHFGARQGFVHIADNTGGLGSIDDTSLDHGEAARS